VKRQNLLFEKITAYQNIRLAFLKTLKGKRASPAALLFCRDIDGNLEKIRNRLAAKPVVWGPYTSFIITDPKVRVISSAPFEDRIIHYALMNVLEPLFERQMIYHTYACRREKGQHAAVQYAFKKCKAAPYFLKLDIRKYFDSIDHEALKNQIRRLIKDPDVLELLDGIIDSYHTAPGKGLPIGNLTSQFFANLYLSKLDHYILEHLKPFAYVRYMDDFVLWAGTKPSLRAMLEKIAVFTREKLRLQLKPPVLDASAQGLPFLGFRIKKQGIYLLKKSKTRMAARIGEIAEDVQRGGITGEKAASRLVSVYAAVSLARTRGLRLKLWNGKRR
jgi:retron-type reverse transcriptase